MRRAQIGSGGAITVAREPVKPISKALELVEPIQKPKMDLPTVLAKLHLNAEIKKRVFIALFEGPLAQKDATKVFKSEAHAKETVNRINQDFRRTEGKNAILVEQAKKQLPWTLRLNPELFEVKEETTLKAEKKLELVDFFSVAQIKLIQAIASANFCTTADLQRMGITPQIIRRQITQGHLNGEFTGLATGIPAPLCKTRTRPELYYIDEKFAEKFGINLRKKKHTLESAFLPTDVKLIRILSSREGWKFNEMKEAIGVAKDTLLHALRRINERCRDLSYPEAVVSEGVGIHKRYDINHDFLNIFGKAAVERKELQSYFSQDQIEIIEYILKNPYVKRKKIAKATGRNRDSFDHLMSRLSAACKRLEESEGEAGKLLIVVGKWNARYCFTKAFCRMFNKKYKKSNPVDLFSPLQKGVHCLLCEDPKITDKKIALKLKTTQRSVIQARLRLNEKLREVGREDLIVQKRRTRKEIDSVKAEKTLKKNLRAIEKIDLTRFKARRVYENPRSTKPIPLVFGPKDIQKAVAGALVRGADHKILEQIIRTQRTAVDVLALINQQGVKGQRQNRK